ncbi:MAG: hypothetical protein RLZZ387_4669 [Chloroflexota bacterium]
MTSGGPRRGGEIGTDELDLIMLHVDEYTARGPRPPSEAVGEEPPGLEDLGQRLQRLRQMRAPLFVVSGWRPADLARRLLNLPIMVLSYKQKHFNDELLDALDATLDALRDTHALVEQQTRELKSLRAAVSPPATPDEEKR